MVKINNKQAAQIYMILTQNNSEKLNNSFDKVGTSFYGEDYNELVNNIIAMGKFLEEYANMKEQMDMVNNENRKLQLIIKSDAPAQVIKRHRGRPRKDEMVARYMN